jgi:hypothetical protein
LAAVAIGGLWRAPPYPGNAPAVNALLGEHVTSMLASYATVAEQLNAGKLRALATESRTRIEPLPEVPTVAESGYKDYEMDYWLGILAPAKTPKETGKSPCATSFCLVSGTCNAAVNQPASWETSHCPVTVHGTRTRRRSVPPALTATSFAPVANFIWCRFELGFAESR